MSRNLPILCCLGWLALVLASAQGAEPLPVAVLNLDHIYSPGTYPRLTEQLAPLKVQAAELQKTVQLRQIELETIQSQLRTTPPNSPQFERLQQQFAKVQAQGQQQIGREQAELQKQEAEIFLDVYRDIDEVLRKYCQEKGIKLVIRRQKATTEGTPSPQEILKAINQTILYEDGLDITEDILKALIARDAQND